MKNRVILGALSIASLLALSSCGSSNKGSSGKVVHSATGWAVNSDVNGGFSSNLNTTQVVIQGMVPIEGGSFVMGQVYDDVMNDQRKTIFEQRLEFMTDDDVSDVIEDMRHQVCEDLIADHVPRKAYAEQWDINGLAARTGELLGIAPPVHDWAAEEGIADEEMLERLKAAADTAFVEKTGNVDRKAIQGVEKQVLLQVIDTNWREHLQQLDHLKSVIGWRSYGQRDPLNEYKSEAFTLFDKLLSDLREGVTRLLMNLQIQAAPPPEPEPAFNPDDYADFNPAAFAGQGGAQGAGAGPARSPQDMLAMSQNPQSADFDLESFEKANGRVPRNAICPCGSGQKFKHCHGKLS